MPSSKDCLAIYLATLAYATGVTSPQAILAEEPTEGTISAFQREADFNLGWRFCRGDHENAALSDFDDSAWRQVDLPHDISIEDLEVQDSRRLGPFSKDVVNGPSVGYLTGGIAWYRKRFPATFDDAEKQVYVHFDGVQSEVVVFVNGKEVGKHVYGYTPFYFNITDYLSTNGSENVIALKVTSPEDSSRWYAGFGVYRDVRISRLQPVHVVPWGLYVTTPQISESKADVAIQVEVANTSSVNCEATIQVDLLNPNGEVDQTIQQQLVLASNTTTSTGLSTSLSDIQLWSLRTPNLYTARIRILQDGVQVDEYRQRFGVRSLEFSADKGFLLNGEEVLLKGACMHHDNGILGAAAFRPAEYRRVQIMKDNGYNAIRCSHNPPSAHFLDACDELGILVIDEAFDMWELPKRSQDYHVHFREWWKRDLRSMMRRDRNHPSIIMWSFGNEIQERCRPRGLAIAEELVKEVRSLDPTRPATQALCGFWDNRGMDWERDTPAAFALMDVSGYNYKPDKYETDHTSYPERVMYGSESYPMEACKYWRKVEEHPFVIGDFVWTGMDYIGESGIGISKIVRRRQNLNHPQKWPWFNANCGDINLIGDKKPQSYYRDVVWGESNLEILVHEHIPEGYFEQTHSWGWPLEHPHWNWEGHEGETMSVSVYTSYPKVRLELNGMTVGERLVDLEQGITAKFDVPYEPGILTAVGIRDDAQESRQLTTAGIVTGLLLETEGSAVRADRNDLLFINVSAIDASGHPAPTATTNLRVQVSGVGELFAAGNGYPLIEGGFQDSQFRLHEGRGLIVVRPTGQPGDILVEVTSPRGLNASSSIRAHKP